MYIVEICTFTQYVNKIFFYAFCYLCYLYYYIIYKLVFINMNIKKKCLYFIDLIDLKYFEPNKKKIENNL